MDKTLKTSQYFKFCSYGFLKNLRFFDAFIILFLLEKGMSFTQIGILYGVREVFVNIFEIPSGFIADTFGRRNSLLGSFILFIASFLVFYIAKDFWFFMLAFLLYGIGDAFRSGTHKGMIMDYLKLNNWGDQKIEYYGHTRSWSQKGSALSALMAGIIVFYSGSYQNIFLYSIIPYVLNFLLILSYPKVLNKSLKKPDNKGWGEFRQTITSFNKSIRETNVIKLLNTSAVHTAYLKAVKDYIQPLMVNVSLLIPLMANIDPDKKSGLVIGIIYFVIYLLTSRASRLSSKVAVKSKRNIPHISLLAGFAFGIICGVLFYYELWIFSLLAFIGIYVIENIRKPILTGFIADNVPNEILTSVISAQSLLRTIITVILALVFGIIADNFGIGISFISVSMILVISTLLINSKK